MTESAVFEIPIASFPQEFSIELGASLYRMSISWMQSGRDRRVTRYPCGGEEVSTGWVLDITDALGEPIVRGIPLVTGCDLLEPYRYLGFSGELRVVSSDRCSVPPTFDSLGSLSKLYFVALPE